MTLTGQSQIVQLPADSWDTCTQIKVQFDRILSNLSISTSIVLFCLQVQPMLSLMILNTNLVEESCSAMDLRAPFLNAWLISVLQILAT